MASTFTLLLALASGFAALPASKLGPHVLGHTQDVGAQISH
jgi:hypothetical protein